MTGGKEQAVNDYISEIAQQIGRPGGAGVAKYRPDDLSYISEASELG